MAAFVQVADKRSIRQAAQAVGLTPSAVGKAISRLEEQLSVRLFHRSTRAVTLTDEGRMFLERCRHIVAEVEAAEAELAHAGAAPRGRLRVGAPVEPTLIVPALADFAAAHPEIELDLDLDDRFVDVIEDGYDAVIRSGEPKDSRLQHRKLGGFVWRFVASPAYVAAHGMPRTTRDLTVHRCLRHRIPESGRLMDWPVAPALDLPSVPATIAASTMGALLELVEKGVGIALLPHFAVDPKIATAALVEVLAAQPKPAGSLTLFWPASRYPLAKLRVFIDFVAVRIGRSLETATGRRR